jgi:hypothetical protein
MNLEGIEQSRDTVLNYKVNHGEIQRKNEDRDYDHRGRGSNFLPRGRGYLAHFSAHIVIEVPDPIGPRLYRRDKRVLFRHGRHLLLLSSHSVYYACAGRFRPQTLAGAEGFEPPSSVLETDSLTVELTPLHQYSVVSTRYSVQTETETAHWLFHFFMRRVLTATVAKFLEFQPFGRRLPILGRRVVPLFAVTAL